MKSQIDKKNQQTQRGNPSRVDKLSFGTTPTKRSRRARASEQCYMRFVKAMDMDRFDWE